MELSLRERDRMCRVHGPTRPRPKPRKPGRDHPWRKQSREEVERAMAKREHRLARLAASAVPDGRADRVSAGAQRLTVGADGG